ncbi:MAG TPA: ABC transporter permease [Bryobacteraceae bacterium]|nr:ABC transporter permease [Bryobacteraceae bacterium]
MASLVAMRNNTVLALDTIRAHKLRTFLTMLGVIIGTGTIIGVGALLTGFDGAITNVLKSFGPNSIMVFKTPAFSNPTPEERARKDLIYQNVTSLRDKCNACENVSPMLWPPRRQLVVTRYKGNAVYQTDLRGVEENYIETGQVEMKAGRFFTDFENRHRESVAVIGADTEKALFSAVDPIGKLISVDGHQAKVIGTMMRPTASFFGNSDNRVLLPYFSMRRMYPTAKDMGLIIAAKEGMLPQAIDQVRTVLRIDRHVPMNKPDDFAISTAQQLVDQFRQITSMTFLVMIILSSIGLLVGGIGVMNIMLVSVTERTKEIGIRKAIGARRVDIITQFLLEATVLTGLGGLVGLGLGWLIAAASRLVFTTLPTQVPAWAAIMGVGVSVAVGLFFGIWPASKAAKLDPVEALRYE